MTDATSLPDLDFTDEDIARAAARKEFLPGKEYIRWLVIGAECRIAGEETKIAHLPQINMRVQALTNPNKADSTVRPTMYVNIPSPIPNRNVQGHVVPDWAPGLCAQALKAMFENDIPGSPHKNKKTGAYEVDGEEIDKSEFDEYKLASVSASLEKFKELWQELKASGGTTTQLSDCVFYGQVVEKDGYININNICTKLPDDGVMRDPEKFFGEVGAVKAAPAKSNGASGRAKPAKGKKKTGKKKTGRRK